MQCLLTFLSMFKSEGAENVWHKVCKNVAFPRNSVITAERTKQLCCFCINLAFYKLTDANLASQKYSYYCDQTMHVPRTQQQHDIINIPNPQKSEQQ